MYPFENKNRGNVFLTPESVPISVLSDNKSLVDAVHKTTSVQNKSLQIYINMLREMIEKGVIREFRWVNTESQIANSLTKRGASTDNLKRLLMNKGVFDHTLNNSRC